MNTLLIFLTLTTLFASVSKPAHHDTNVLSHSHAHEVATKKPIVPFDDECEFEDLVLHGKVKFVDSSPDLKIKFVNSLEDLRVKFVSSFPDDCGEWQVVDSFPDFKVQVVNSGADLKVKVVQSFPGMR